MSINSLYTICDGRTVHSVLQRQKRREPGFQGAKGGVAQIMAQLRPHPGQQLQTSGLVVALGQPDENPQDFAITLGARQGVLKIDQPNPRHTDAARQPK